MAGVGKFRISAGALKQGKILPSAFYPSEITGVEHKLANNKESMNHWVSFKVLHGPGKDIILRLLINEKGLDESTGARGAAIVREMLEAIGVPIDEENGLEIDWEALKGQKLDVFSKPGKDQNDKSVNEVSGFKKYTEAAA